MASRAEAGPNINVPAERRLEFRMGIKVGDIIIEDGDIFGDGVNIAARLEALAEPDRICVSAAAHERVRDRLDIGFDDIGEQQVKNITRPVRVYSIGSRSPGARVIETQVVSLPPAGEHLALYFDCAAHRVDNTGELDQQSVASGLYNATLQPPRVFIQKIAAVTRTRSSLNAGLPVPPQIP